MNNNLIDIGQEDKINLLEVVFELLNHWFFIGLVTVLTGAIVFAVNYFFITPMYQSTAELYLLDNSTSISSLTDIQIGNNLTQDYIKITASRPVLDTVIENLGLNESYKSLSGRLSVTNDVNTHILKISVKDANPSKAKAIADETAKVARSFIVEKMGQKEPSVLHYGYIDETPVSPAKIKNTLTGAIIGFILSCAAVLVGWIFNDTIRSEEDVERKLKLKVLGVIPQEDTIENKTIKKKNNKKNKENR